MLKKAKQLTIRYLVTAVIVIFMPIMLWRIPESRKVIIAGFTMLAVDIGVALLIAAAVRFWYIFNPVDTATELSGAPRISRRVNHHLQPPGEKPLSIMRDHPISLLIWQQKYRLVTRLKIVLVLVAVYGIAWVHGGWWIFYVIMLTLAWAVVRVLRWYYRRWVITANKLMLLWGVLSDHMIFMPVSKVTDAEYEIPLWSRALQSLGLIEFACGSAYVETAGHSRFKEMRLIKVRLFERMIATLTTPSSSKPDDDGT